MIIKGIIDEDIVNYKKISMVIIFPYCNFKCDKEFGSSVCQNGTLATKYNNIDMGIDKIIHRYLINDMTEAIIFQGLEPFDSFNDVVSLIISLRKYCEDDVVIYTGYNKDEISDKINILKEYSNIIIKYGRYIPNQDKHYDALLGVDLASRNQYAERIC